MSVTPFSRRTLWLWAPWLCLLLCTGSQASAQASPLLLRRSYPPVPGYAESASVGGLAFGGLLAAGGVGIAVAGPHPSEELTRGLLFGSIAISAPVVAFGAYLTRRRTRLPGSRSRAVRRLAWLTYAGALGIGTVQWYDAFHGRSAPAGLTVFTGALGALACMGHAFDAYMAQREAEASLSLSWSAAGLGLSGRF